MIRPTVPADAPELLAITAGTGNFSKMDVEALDEVLTDYFAENAALGHRCATYEQDGKIIGFTYFGLAPMTDRTWDLWWIVGSKQYEARGVGGEMLHSDDAARPAETGLVMVTTSSSDASDDLRTHF